MFLDLNFKALTFIPKLANHTTKIALGGFLLFFFLDYQPTLGIPPLKKSVVKASFEQSQSIDSKSIPFEFKLPHPGYVSTHFSTYHPGTDIATGLRMLIHPVASGTILEAGYNFFGLGLVVTVDHGSGYKSLYAHLGKTFVKKGQTVSIEDTLGQVGLTGRTSGPHTHVELSKDGANFDPETVLPKLASMPVIHASSSAALSSK